MPIVANDIKIKFSTTAGSAGNSTTGTAAGSLGKYISTTEITDATIANVFANLSGDDNAASAVHYRCVFVHNSHATLTWQAPVVWLSSEVAGGAAAAISIDTTAASAIGSSSAQAKDIATETTAPTSQTFSAPTSKGTGLALADLPAGQCRAIWLRRTAANTSALDNDGVVIRIEGDTAA